MALTLAKHKTRLSTTHRKLVVVLVFLVQKKIQNVELVRMPAIKPSQTPDEIFLCIFFYAAKHVPLMTRRNAICWWKIRFSEKL